MPPPPIPTRAPPPTPTSIPILLLKSPSSPSPSSPNPYTTTFPPPQFTLSFLPPLHTTHLPLPASLLAALSATPPAYAALIFTSQRAVRAFVEGLAVAEKGLEEGLGEGRWEEGRVRLPLYAVGPATGRALKEMVLGGGLRGCWVVGEEAGRGEELAGRVVGDLVPGGRGGEGGAGIKVLFVTGETRRDDVPRILGQAGIVVEEAVVYGTAVDPVFEHAVRERVGRDESEAGNRIRWVVVFSPQGGRELLRALDWLDSGGGMKVGISIDVRRRVYVASIGPTTGEYLEREFGLRADVQAGRPDAEGLREGIEGFMKERRWWVPV